MSETKEIEYSATITWKPGSKYQSELMYKAVTKTLEALQIYFTNSHKKNEITISTGVTHK